LEKRYSEAKENVERAATFFTWRNEAAKMIDFYAELLAR
jgi:hypothetical protein